jgi:hypothetical protein
MANEKLDVGRAVDTICAAVDAFLDFDPSTLSDEEAIEKIIEMDRMQTVLRRLVDRFSLAVGPCEGSAPTNRAA